MHLTSKFHHPTFNRLEVIVLTNKQTDAAENIHLAPLRYTPMDNDDLLPFRMHTAIYCPLIDDFVNERCAACFMLVQVS